MQDPRTIATAIAAAALYACLATATAAPARRAASVGTTHSTTRSPAGERHAGGKRVSAADIDCIASVVWHEARSQVRNGQIAVAEVVLRRRDSGRFPRTACGVVRQRAQFSFVHAGVIPVVPGAEAPRIRQLVRDVIDGRLRSPVRGAMFFHAAYVNPGWDRRLVGRIGSHLFYR